MAEQTGDCKTRNVARRIVAYLRQTESLVLISAFCVVAGVLAFSQIADEMVEGDTQRFDEQVLLRCRRPDSPAQVVGPSWMGEAARDLSGLGSAPVLVVIVVLVTGFFVLSQRYRMACIVLLAPCSGVLLSTLLKSAFHRGRPSVVPHLDAVTSASFPSGHSMLSAIVYLTLGALLAQTVRARWLKAYALAAAMLLAFVVGVSRVVLGVHYPTDVLAGWAAGLAWAFLWQLGERALTRATSR